MTEYRITTFEGAYRVESRERPIGNVWSPWNANFSLRHNSFEEARTDLENRFLADRFGQAEWTPVDLETGLPASA